MCWTRSLLELNRCCHLLYFLAAARIERLGGHLKSTWTWKGSNADYHFIDSDTTGRAKSGVTRNYNQSITYFGRGYLLPKFEPVKSDPRVI